MNGVFIDEKYYRFLIMKETTPIHTHIHIYTYIVHGGMCETHFFLYFH